MTKTEIVLHDNPEKRSHNIKVTTEKGEFHVPVVDVRDGDDVRRTIKGGIKAANAQRGSKFMRPSFGEGGGCYQTSYKVLKAEKKEEPVAEAA